MLRMPRLFGVTRPRVVLPPNAAYELWADTYPPVAHNPLMRAEQDVVGALLGRVGATRALDVGTGAGRYLPVLESAGASVVLGLDSSLAMLARCSRAGRVCGDACRLPFRRGSFDLVNASLMVGDVADLGRWAREMARVLAVNGHLIYSDFHPSWKQNGWRRTFRGADGVTRELTYVPHSVDDHLAALEDAGLRVIAIREPRLRESDGSGVGPFRRRRGNPPVVVVFHAMRDARPRRPIRPSGA
jgi:malonyl-CoA O-methyltransferase